MNIDNFKKFAVASNEKFQNIKYKEAFLNIDWQANAKKIEASLLDNYRKIHCEIDSLGKEDLNILLLDFRWDDADSESSIMIDFDFGQSVRSLFSDGPNNPHRLIDFSEFIEENIAPIGEFRDLSEDDYENCVDLFSKLTIEVILKLTKSIEFNNINKAKKTLIAYTYFHDESGKIFYKSDEPVESLFDDTGFILSSYLTVEEELETSFKLKDIKRIIEVVPKAANTGTLIFETAAYCNNFIIEQIKTKDKKAKENIYRILKKIEISKKSFSKLTKLYEEILSNVLCVPDSKIDYIKFIEEKMLPKSYNNATVPFNLACNFSRLEVKGKFLFYTKIAIELGKPVESFDNDSDFDKFRNDKEFKTILQESKLSLETLSLKFSEAIDGGKFEEAKNFLEQGANINNLYGSFDENAIDLAANSWGDKKEKAAFVSFLLERGIQVSVDTLQRAIRNKDMNIISSILDTNILNTLNKEEKKKVLLETCEDGNKETLDLLVENGMKPQKLKDDNCFHYVRIREDLDLVYRLIELGVDPNGPNGSGRKPLHSIASANNIPLLQCLIDAGADVNAKDNQGNTPVGDAFSNDNENVVEYLLKNGADLHHINDNGETLLHKCIETGAKACFPKLTEAGIDLNTVNNQGNSALHIASEYGYVNFVRELINLGVAKDVPNKENKTPLDLADSKQVKEFFQ